MSGSPTPSRYYATANRPRSRPNSSERALAWGWPADRIRVLDGDQGRSGTTTAGRDDFAWLLSEIALEHVGLVLCFQINRLAREDEDCCRLIKVCGTFNTLLADQDGLYHPHDFNDRMLLTIKGFMGGFELHQIQQRMQAGRLNRCRRGEWLGQPPPGYVVGPDRKLQFDPDEQVQEVVRLVLEQFAALGSVSGVLRYLRQQRIQLPCRPVGGLDAGNCNGTRPTARRCGSWCVTRRMRVPTPGVGSRRIRGAPGRVDAAAVASVAARGLPGVPSRQSRGVHFVGAISGQPPPPEQHRRQARSLARRGRRWRSWPGLVVCGRMRLPHADTLYANSALCVPAAGAGLRGAALPELGRRGVGAVGARPGVGGGDARRLGIEPRAAQECERERAALDRQWRLRLERAARM